MLFEGVPDFLGGYVIEKYLKAVFRIVFHHPHTVNRVFLFRCAFHSFRQFQPLFDTVDVGVVVGK